MWFNNALVYQFELPDVSQLSQQLAQDTLKPCPPHARFTYGWISAYQDELVQEVAGCQLICMAKEERILPRSVIQRVLNERVATWEIHNNRTMKRAEKAQLAEELEFELLPKSFCVQKKMYALFEHVSKRLFINTASPNQASQLISLLRKSCPTLKVEPLQHEANTSLHFKNWLQQPTSLPSQFQLASDCVLHAENNEKKRFNCKGCELPSDEILTLLEQGLSVSEISIIWNERMSFTLSEDLTIKRIKCLDYLLDDLKEASDLEEEYQQRDAELTLLGGELRTLTDDLLKALHANNYEKTKPVSESEEIVA